MVTKLFHFGKHSRLDGSLAWPKPSYCTGYFTGRVSQLMINPQKPCNFSTLNDLQYTVVWEKFMVRNIREKKIRGKKFSSKQATDKNFLMPNIS